MNERTLQTARAAVDLCIVTQSAKAIQPIPLDAESEKLDQKIYKTFQMNEKCVVYEPKETQ